MILNRIMLSSKHSLITEIYMMIFIKINPLTNWPFSLSFLMAYAVGNFEIPPRSKVENSSKEINLKFISRKLHVPYC